MKIYSLSLKPPTIDSVAGDRIKIHFELINIEG